MEPHSSEFRTGRDGVASIAVFRALQLGDLLCSVPALRSLRAAYPAAHIALIGLPNGRTLVDRFAGYLDEHIVFPGFPGLPEQRVNPRRTVTFMQEMQDRKFDLLLQMHGRGDVSNPMTMLMGARMTAGFFVPGQFCPAPSRYLPYPAEQPEVLRHLALMEFLGFPSRGHRLEFPHRPSDVDELREALGDGRLQGRDYVVVHAGARARFRRWRPGKFAAVADSLARRGMQVVLTGAEGERTLVARVEAAMETPCINLAGKTSLGALSALLRGARLVVCNDTGVSHLAAAVHTPSVVIFTGSDPVRWAPLDRNLHRVVGSGPFSARDWGQPFSGTAGRVVPTVASVLAEATSLLAKEADYVA